MAQITNHPRRVRAFSVALLVAAALLGACSGSGTNTTTANAPSTTAGSSSGGGNVGGTAGTSSKGTTKGTTKADTTLNTKVWWQGFRYDLGDVSLDTEKQQLMVKTKITNLGSDPANPYPPVVLVNGGEEVARGGLAETPSITGGKTVDATIQMSVKDDFTVDGTSLLFSNGSSQVEATVPLDGKGDKVTLEPIEQAQAPDPITIGSVTITPKTAEVRWDLPSDHSIEAEAGTAFLVISGTAKNDGTSTAYFSATGITITTDTGTYPVKLIGDNYIPAKQSTDKFSIYFQIKDPVEGTWTIDFKDQPFGVDAAKVSASAKATVSKQQKSSTGTTR